LARPILRGIRRLSARIVPAGSSTAYSFTAARQYWGHVPRAQGGDPLHTAVLATVADHEVAATFERELDIARRKPERRIGFDLAVASIEGVDAPRVLDYGSGIGFYGFEILARRPDALVTFADINATNLDQVERLARLRGVAGRMETVLVTEPDASNLAFEEPFDLIVSMGVLHHTPHARAIVRHLVTALKPGGVFESMLYNDVYLRQEEVAAGHKLNESTFGARTDPRIGALSNPFSEPYDETKTRELFAGLEAVDIHHPQPEYDTYRFRKP
jgi:SAM-dependent methyltransferase